MPHARAPRRPAFLAVTLLAVALLAVAAPAPAGAQSPQRSVVVPAEGQVVIPPRSAPRLAAAPPGAGVGVPIPRAGSGTVFLRDTGTGLAAPLAGMILPALAGALLGGTIAGSRGGNAAPARTR